MDPVSGNRPIDTPQAVAIRWLRNGNAGTDWTDFVDQHCESTVSELAAVVLTEAPGTATAANVLVTGTVNTTCPAGAAQPVEHAAATWW